MPNCPPIIILSIPCLLRNFTKKLFGFEQKYNQAIDYSWHTFYYWNYCSASVLGKEGI